MLQSDAVKKVLTFLFFFGIAGYLVWCGNRYNDRNYSLIPAMMCAAESVLLMITGAAMIRTFADDE